MDSILTQLGIGGILALLVLDRVFAFLKGRGSEGAGALSPDYWQQTNKRLMGETIETLVLPILKTQTEILARLEARTGQNYDMHMKHGFLLDKIEESLERLRVTSHGSFQLLQQLVKHPKDID